MREAEKEGKTKERTTGEVGRWQESACKTARDVFVGMRSWEV